jgi:cardiolipin synthase
LRAGLANHLTLSRFVLVIPVAVMILQEKYWVALAIYAAAGVTDILDGVVARRRGSVSPFGVLLDPLADIAITTAVFGALFANGLVPLWVMVLLGVRYGMLFAGCAVFWLTMGPVRFQATPAGKMVGVLQAAIAIIIIVVAAVGRPWHNGIGYALHASLGLLFMAAIVSQGLHGIRYIRQGALNE